MSILPLFIMGLSIYISVVAEEMTHGNKRRRGLASQPLTDFHNFINLESTKSSLVIIIVLHELAFYY